MQRIKTLTFFLSLSLFTFRAVNVFSESNLIVTCGAFIEGVTTTESNANSHGVYPVMLSWDETSDTDFYTVMRFDEDENAWEVCANLKPTDEGLKFSRNTNTGARRLVYIDRNINAVPNKIYQYKVLSSNRLKGIVRESEIKEGYGALTAVSYMDTYNNTIVASHGKLTLMHKKRALQKLGKERGMGDLCGSLFYNARVRGFHGVVTVEYNDFRVFPGWTLNGNTNVKANIWANGKMLNTVHCTGMYPGDVSYDHIKIKKGKAGGGYYTVVREGFPPVDVAWNALEIEIKKIYEEVDDNEPTNIATLDASSDDDKI